MATKQSIDFTNVKEGGNFSKKHMPSGDYLAKVTKVDDHKSKEGNQGWVFTIQLKDTASATYPYYCMFADNQLWKVRNLLVAAGITVPKKKVGVDPEKLVGKTIAVSLDDTEYNGKDQSEIGAVFSPADLAGSVDVDEPDDDEDDEDDDEAPPPPKKSKKAKVEEPEDEDDEDDEDDEPAPPKKKKKAPAPAEDEDDDEVDIEDLD